MSIVTRNAPVDRCEYCWAMAVRGQIDRTEVKDAEISVNGPDMTRIEMCLDHARIVAAAILEEIK